MRPRMCCVRVCPCVSACVVPCVLFVPYPDYHPCDFQLSSERFARGGSMSGLPKKEECVRVVVRCRPMSSKETADGRQKVVEMDKKRGSVRARCL